MKIGFVSRILISMPVSTCCGGTQIFLLCNSFKENKERERELSSLLNRVSYKLPTTWKCSFPILLNCLNIERYQMGMRDGIVLKYFSHKQGT